MELRQYIASQMERRRLNQKHIAQKLGRDASTISNWLNGNYPIPLDALDDLAEAIEERTPIRIYTLAGLFAGLPDSARHLIEMMEHASDDQIKMMERLAEALVTKQD